MYPDCWPEDAENWDRSRSRRATTSGLPHRKTSSGRRSRASSIQDAADVLRRVGLLHDQRLPVDDSLLLPALFDETDARGVDLVSREAEQALRARTTTPATSHPASSPRAMSVSTRPPTATTVFSRPATAQAAVQTPPSLRPTSSSSQSTVDDPAVVARIQATVPGPVIAMLGSSLPVSGSMTRANMLKLRAAVAFRTRAPTNEDPELEVPEVPPSPPPPSPPTLQPPQTPPSPSSSASCPPSPTSSGMGVSLESGSTRGSEASPREPSPEPPLLPLPFERNRAIQSKLKEMIAEKVYVKLRAAFPVLKLELLKAREGGAYDALLTSLAMSRFLREVLMREEWVKPGAADPKPPPMVRQRSSRRRAVMEKLREEMSQRLEAKVADSPVQEAPRLSEIEFGCVEADIKAYLVRQHSRGQLEFSRAGLMTWTEMLGLFGDAHTKKDIRRALVTEDLLLRQVVGTSQMYARMGAALILGKVKTEAEFLPALHHKAARVVTHTMRLGAGRLRLLSHLMWERQAKGFKAVLRQCLHTWKRNAQNAAASRSVLRKLRGWRRFLAQRKRVRETYRVAFWPLRVWAKETRLRVVAKRKAMFLLRVWETLATMRITKAWRGYTLFKIHQRQLVAVGRSRVATTLCRNVFGLWSTFVKFRTSLAVQLSSLAKPTAPQLLKMAVGSWRMYTSSKRAQRHHRRMYSLPGFATAEELGRLPPRYRTRVAYAQASNAEEWAIRRVKPLTFERRTLPPGPAPSFPTVTDWPWFKRFNMPVIRLLCAPMVVRVARKAKVQALATRAAFIRVVPKAMAQWVRFVRHRRKKRYAWYLGTQPCCKRAFRSWRDGVRAGLLTEASNPSVAARYRGRRTRTERAAAMQASEARAAVKAKAVEGAWERDATWRINATDEATRNRNAAIVVQHRTKEWWHCVEQLRANMGTRFKKVDVALDEYLEEQTASTMDEIRFSAEHVAKVKLSHSKIMHDALYNGFENMAKSAVWYCVRAFFGELRRLYFRSIVRSLYNKAKLRQWLRICYRFMFLERNVHLYRRLRVKWVTFNKWFKYTVGRVHLTTPGLKPQLKKQRGALMRLGNMVQGMAEEDAKAAADSLRGVFYRWTEFTSVQSGYRRVVELSLLIRRKRLMRRVFRSWATGLKAKYLYSGSTDTDPSSKSVQRILAERRPFAERRLEVDRDVVRKVLLQPVVKAHSTWLRRKAALASKRTDKRRAKLAADRMPMSLTELVEGHQTEVERCVRHERRLLFATFQDRRNIQAHVTETPMEGGVSGMEFRDSVPHCATVSSVTAYHGEGVFGLQLTWVSGLSRAPLYGPVHGIQRGKPSTFDLVPGEVIVAMQACISNMVGRIKFFTSHGRQSPWFGRGEAGKDITVGSFDAYHDAQNGIKCPDFDSLCSLQGLAGRHNSGGVVALAGVLRQVYQKNALANCWTELEFSPDVAEENNLVEAHFSTLMRIRCTEIKHAMHRAHAVARFISTVSLTDVGTILEPEPEPELEPEPVIVRPRRRGRRRTFRVQPSFTEEGGGGDGHPTAWETSSVSSRPTMRRSTSHLTSAPSFGTTAMPSKAQSLPPFNGNALLRAVPTGLSAFPSFGTSTTGPTTFRGTATLGSTLGSTGTPWYSKTAPVALPKLRRTTRTVGVLKDGISLEVPVALTPPHIAFAICKWMFRAFTKFMVRDVDDTDMVQGGVLLRRGLELRVRGRSLLEQAEALMKRIPKDKHGEPLFDAAMDGEAKTRSLLKLYNRAVSMKVDGTGVLARGDKHVEEAYKMLPTIPATTATRTYYEGLARAAMTLGTMSDEHANQFVDWAKQQEEARQRPAAIAVDTSIRAELRDKAARSKYAKLAGTSVFKALAAKYDRAYDIGFGSMG